MNINLKRLYDAKKQEEGNNATGIYYDIDTVPRKSENEAITNRYIT